MASLRVLEEQPTRLVLGKGGGNAIGSLIGIVIFGVVACVGLSSLLGEGGEFNPVMLVIVLVIGLVGVVSAINSIVSTRVVLDADQKVATRTDSLFFFPTRQKSLAFNTIRDVAVTSARTPDALSFDSYPIWQAELRSADGTTLVLNERGTRAEMDSLAEQVGRLVGRPVKTGAKNASQTFTPAKSAAGGFAPALDATSAATIAPVVSLFPDESPRPAPGASYGSSPDSPYLQASARMAAQQVARGAPNAATNAQMASDRATAFSSDLQVQSQMANAQVAAGASIEAANAQMTADRAAAFSSDAQTQVRMRSAQVAAGVPMAAANAQMTADLVSAFSSDLYVQSQMANAQVAAGAPFTAASGRLAQQQAEAQAAMGFTMPAMLTMPELPPMLSFGSSLNMPSFAPMAVGFEPMASPLPVMQETRQIETDDSEPAPDNSPLFVQARKLLGARNYRDAEKAYLAALSTNPADAGAQNDLGVVYYGEHKFNDAQNAFRRSMALDPFHFEARYNLGLVLNRTGKRSEAQEVFRVGAQTAGRQMVKYFQDALRGVLHDPLTSSR